MDRVRQAEEDAVEAEALRWLARRDRGLTAAETAEFEAWRSAETRHAAALAKLNSIWTSMDRLQSLSARSGGVPDPDLLARTGPRSPWLIPAWVGAAAALLVLGWMLAPRFAPQPARPAPAAVVSSVRSLKLPDGSVVELEPGAQVEDHFTANERQLRLSKGEAVFRVVKNPHRPFVVSAGTLRIRAVGTVFDVRLERAGVRVAVTEGKVWAGRDSRGPLEDPAADQGSRYLAAGESADFLLAVPPSNLNLVFKAEPLSEVAAQFNRHNRVQLLIADPATGAMRVGGTFRADNLSGFLRLIGTSAGVKSRADGPDRIVLFNGN